MVGLLAVFAGFGMLFGAIMQSKSRDWVAGGDGWLMLMHQREPRAWVRTDRLVHIDLKPTYAGEGDRDPHLTLRDDEGRELQTWLATFRAEAAAALLAGIQRSAEDYLLAGPDSGTAQAAVTALYEMAAAAPPVPASQRRSAPARRPSRRPPQSL
jgi:hypothetical protein